MLIYKIIKNLLAFIIATIAALFDQLGKCYTVYHFCEVNNICEKRTNCKIEILPSFINLIYRENCAAAFNVMGFLPRQTINFFLLIVCSIVTFLICRIYLKIKNPNKIISFTFICVTGGAIANILDRIKTGHVVDYIDVCVNFLIFKLHWPTFNLADFFIIVAMLNVFINHPARLQHKS